MRIKPRKYIDGTLYFQCSICKQWKTASDYYKEKRNLIGITSGCKICHTKENIRTRNNEKKREADTISRHNRRALEKSKIRVSNLENEVWKEINDSNGSYFVSNLGRVKSRKWGKEILLKQSTSEKGYKMVCIHINGKGMTKRVHKLVALSFIPNPNSLNEINHKDENKANNSVSNLEWCDRKYNMGYGTWKERRKRNHDQSLSVGV